MEAESMIGVGLATGLGFVLYSLLFKEPEIAETKQLDKFQQKVARGEVNFNKQAKSKQQAKPKAPVFIETKEVVEAPEKKKAAKKEDNLQAPVQKTFAVSKKEKAKQANKGFEVVAKKGKEVSSSEKKKRAQLNKLEKELEKVREADKAARDLEFAERRAARERMEAEKKEKEPEAEVVEKQAKSSNQKIKEILDAQKKEKLEKAKNSLVKGVAKNVAKPPKPAAAPAEEEGEAEGEEVEEEEEEEKGWKSVDKADDFTSVLASEADEKISRRMAPAAFPELK